MAVLTPAKIAAPATPSPSPKKVWQALSTRRSLFLNSCSCRIFDSM